MNPFTNQLIFFSFDSSTETYLMHIVDAGTFASITIPAPDSVAMNPATNQIYGASGGQVFLIDAVTGQTTPVLTVPTSPDGVNLNLTVNPATNNLYVSIQAGDGGSASTLVVDGASNSILQTLPGPVTAVNPLANQVLLGDYLVSGPAVQAAPVTTTITPSPTTCQAAPRLPSPSRLPALPQPCRTASISKWIPGKALGV